MVIQFATRRLRDICEDLEVAEEVYGRHANAILTAVADLMAAPLLSDFPPLLLEPIDRAYHEYRANYGKCSLIFRVNHRNLPISENGGLDIKGVTRVKIVEITIDE